MKAKNAARTFCPIRGTQMQQTGDQLKTFNQPCSANCAWWVWWPNKEEETENGDREGYCIVHDIAGAIENIQAVG